MRAFRLALLLAAWMVAVSFCLWTMTKYAMTSTEVALPPGRWPADSRLPFNDSLPTLVMFVHPRCPCSRASLDELAILTTHCLGRMNLVVAFVKPPGVGKDWEKTNLWRAAESIPGAALFADLAGREAARFRATVSGETLLYASDGQLLFHGGLTAARGHLGDNPGRSALESLLAGSPAAQRRTPVFGCSLGGSTCARPLSASAQTP